MALTAEEVEKELDEEHRQALDNGEDYTGLAGDARKSLGPGKSYFDENDTNGEFREGRVDVAEDSQWIDKEQLYLDQKRRADKAADNGFIEGGAKRTGDPLATSTGDLEGNYRQSIADASKGGTVVGTGARLADDRSWEARYNDMMARRKAERAGLKAQSLARQELLDTGKYFDDGRGNIKLKKSEREFRRPDSTRRGWHVDTTADNGAGMRYIKKAGQDAYSGSMNGWQQALNAQNAEKQNSVRNEFEAYAARNKAAMEKREEDRELKKKRNASDNWVLTSGIFAALNDLKNGPAGTKDRITDEEVDDKSKPAKRQAITDSKGAIMGYKDVYKKKNVGKIKNGYLDPSEVDMINRQLEANGNKRWRLKGIVAQQRFDPKLGNENSDTARKGKPYVLVNIEMKDPQTGEWKPASRYMTMDTLYKFGVDNGKDSGRTDAEDIIAEKLGDPNGYLKRKKEAAAHELELARIKAGEGRAAITAKGNAEVANINAQAKRDVAAINAAAKGFGKNGQSVNDDKYDKARMEAMKAWLDANGRQISNDEGDTIDNPNYDERLWTQRKNQYESALWEGGGAGGQQGAESAAGGADVAQAATGNSMIDAKRNELIRRGVLNQDGTPRIDGAQPQTAQGQQRKAPDRSALPSPTGPRYGGVIKPGDSYTFEPVPGDEDDSIRVVNSDGGVVGVISKKDGRRFVYNKDATSDDDYYSEIPKGTPAPWEKSDAKTDGAQAQRPSATGNAPQQNVQNVGNQSGAAIVKDVVEKNGGKKQKGKVVNAKKPETKSTQTGNNVTETASSAVRRSDKNYEEAPMMPEERRAKIMKELKDWQWQQKQIGNDVSDEELEELADRRMEDETGVRPIRRSASKK